MIPLTIRPLYPLTGLALALLVSCGRPSLPIGDEEAGLGYRPVQLVEGETKLYVEDYVLSEVESVDWPKGLTARYQKDSAIYRITGRMDAPLGTVTFHAADGEYSLLLKQSMAQPVTFRYGPASDSLRVTLFGSFNNWNRSATPMRYVGDSAGGNYQATLNLPAGNYAYKFFVQGEERLCPGDDSTLVPNGFGSFNHSLTVTLPGQPCQPLRALSVGDAGTGEDDSFVVLDTLPEDQEVLAFWNTYAMPASAIERQSDGTVWVYLPKDSDWSERNHLHLYSHNGAQISNDILIPFGEDQMISSTSQLNRSDWENATLYFMMVDRFFNGDSSNDAPLNRPDVLPLADYMGGDVAGITQAVESGYFEDFGFNTVWLSPIGRNPEGAYGLWNKGGVMTRFSGYHGYWPTSAKKLDRRMASPEQLHQLLEVAHGRNLNVLLDYVANHVHLDHPVYKQHRDWATSLYLPDSSLNTERWDDYRLTTWFDTHLPTLDLRRPEVVEPMTDSALVWMTDYGIDGFRHDATKHVDLLYWRTLTKKLKKQNQSGQRLYQIGETYGSPDLIASYLGNGMLDAQFDFNFYDAAVQYCADLGTDAARMASVLQNSLNVYGYHHLMGNISGNQDKPRFISLADRNVSPDEDSKLAGYTRDIQAGDTLGYQRLALLHALNHAVPGIPVVYYGDEYGMAGGNDPDNRRFMKWSNYRPAEQALRLRTQEIVTARKNSMALTYGYTEVFSPSADVLVIHRQYLSEHVWILLNRGAGPYVHPLTQDVTRLAGNAQIGISSATVAPYSFVYLQH